MMFAGDSTTPTVAGTTLDAITSTWPYAKIRGFIADGFNGITYSNWGSSSYGGINGVMTVSRTFADSVGSGSGATPGSLDLYRLWNTANGSFTGSTIPNPTSAGSNDLYRFDLDTNRRAVNTFDGVPVKAFAVVGSNPNGLADFQVVGHDDSTVYESSADASARSAGDLTFKRVEVTLSPRTYSTHGLDIAVRPKAGTTPSASDNLIVSRVGIDAGGNGLLLNFINFGGKTAQFFADPSAVADSYWESTVAAQGTDLCYYALGINDSGSRTKAQYKADVLRFIARAQAANPSMDFLLVAEHEVSQNAKTISQYASALWEDRAVKSTCYFIDGFSLNGPYATTASTFIASGGAEPGPYIVDGTHFVHEAGDLRFQSAIASQINAGAAKYIPAADIPGSASASVASQQQSPSMWDLMPTDKQRDTSSPTLSDFIQ